MWLVRTPTTARGPVLVSPHTNIKLKVGPALTRFVIPTIGGILTSWQSALDLFRQLADRDDKVQKIKVEKGII